MYFLLREVIGMGAMPTLDVGMWRLAGVPNIPTASVGMAPSTTNRVFPPEGGTTSMGRKRGGILMAIVAY